MTILEQGLLLSALGIGLTFAALLLIIGLIHLLRAVFPAAAPDRRPVSHRAHADAERERRVAILAAVWVVRTGMHRARPKDPALGQRLESGPGGYWQANPPQSEKR